MGAMDDLSLLQQSLPASSTSTSSRSAPRRPPPPSLLERCRMILSPSSHRPFVLTHLPCTAVSSSCRSRPRPIHHHHRHHHRCCWSKCRCSSAPTQVGNHSLHPHPLLSVIAELRAANRHLQERSEAWQQRFHDSLRTIEQLEQQRAVACSAVAGTSPSSLPPAKAVRRR